MLRNVCFSSCARRRAHGQRDLSYRLDFVAGEASILWRRFVRDLRWLAPAMLVCAVALAAFVGWKERSQDAFWEAFVGLSAVFVVGAPLLWWRSAGLRLEGLAERRWFLASLLWCVTGMILICLLLRQLR